MAEGFAKAVDDGLKLSKRLYFGKDRAVSPPKPLPSMDKSASADPYLPTAPMVYAIIHDPKIVDNPDIPSYQPHVHGRCDPPALIPLQMNRIDLTVDCYLDTAFVRVSGSWRVHCVMGSKSCDCRIAIPMGDEGSILGVEVEVSRKSYSTQLVSMETDKDAEKGIRADSGVFLKPQIFMLTIPQIAGGSNLSINLSWSQKLNYSDGLFSVTVPFKFPEYVASPIKKLPKKEKIQLNVNAGTGSELLCKTTTHPLKQLRRDVGKLGYLYEAEVLKWSSIDFTFSYTVSTSHVKGGVLLQSPLTDDVDQREMFCVYLFPEQQSRKVLKKDVVFVVDISGSMQGRPLEITKTALSAALSKLDQGDSFNIIAFNGETYLFSSSMELATNKAIERASEWININLIAGGSTNISVPLTKAVEMLTNNKGSIPIIFLVTDGAVEDDRKICDGMRSHLTNEGSIHPRIHSFGVGTFCNHYFLRMLAAISGGQYDAAIALDIMEFKLQNFFSRGLSTVLANITIDALKDLDGFEMYPSRMPDLSSESLLMVSGRYQGKFPDSVTAKGVSGGLINEVIVLKVQNTKDIPLDRVFAKQQIDLLTAQAWFSEDKQLEEKVIKRSIQTGNLSEYTRMVILESIESVQTSTKSNDTLKKADSKLHRTIFIQGLQLGFGDLQATAANTQPDYQAPKLPEAAEIFVKAASDCCSSICNKCCCMCCIQCCSKINDQCAIVLTQLCTALACFGCFECWSSICCCGQEGQ